LYALREHNQVKQRSLGEAMNREELAFELALKVWERWHGPMAKIPATHDQCASELCEMLKEIDEKERYSCR
jgi:hypothetical protein